MYLAASNIVVLQSCSFVLNGLPANSLSAFSMVPCRPLCLAVIHQRGILALNPAGIMKPSKVFSVRLNLTIPKGTLLALLPARV